MWQQTALIIGTKESSRELFIVLFPLQLECSVGVFIKTQKQGLIYLEMKYSELELVYCDPRGNVKQTMNTEQSELKDEKYLFAFSFFARMLQQSRGRVYGKEDTTSQSAVR